jgi:hypothetical protein
MSLTLRTLRSSPLSNKELDDNFTFLDGRINTLNNTISNVNTTLDAKITSIQSSISSNALTAPSGNGIVVKTTTAGATVARQIAVSGSGLSITNANGISGNPTIASNATTANTPNTLALRDSTGSINVVDLNSTSDRTLKEDIKEIQSPIDILKSIDGIEFKWKETHKKSYGVIAQDLEKVLPELVVNNGSQLSVNYIPLIAILIEAIKEQQIQIENKFPVGSILFFAKNAIIDNWLVADGRSICRSKYSSLFSIIGTTYGDGDGSMTFNLPNLNDMNKNLTACIKF